jgi:Protein of unknown function (DUF3592)
MSELQTTGVVIDHKSRSSVGFDSYSRLLFPVVRFETQDGKTVEFESGLGTNIPPRVGEEVTVIYEPSRPQEAKVTVGSTLRFRPKMLVVAGVAALFVVLVPFIAFVLLLLWATL